MEAIFNRRSVRKYRPEPIPQAQLTRLFQAAMRAPSAGNEQPWEFILIKSRETMEKIHQFHPFSGMLDQADCAVLVCGNRRRQKFPWDYWVQDCAAATQNMLLEAYHLGIGAVWLGVYPETDRVEAAKALFGLPEHVMPLGLVSLGYPAETPPPQDTYLPERIHSERW